MNTISPSQNLGKYLQDINNAFKNEGKKSLSEILDSFSIISEDYSNFTNTSKSFTYSNYQFNNCSGEERVRFANEQLQFVETLVCDKIYSKTGDVVNWWDIYKMLYDPVYAQTEKTRRKVVFSTAGSDRPIGDNAYNIWNGLQIIDLDIKDEELSSKLKDILFDELKKYNWFLGVCRSASKRGLHVWTKIRPISKEFNNRRVEYLCNFRHKYSYVYIILMKHAAKLGYTKDDVLKYMDMAMAKPQQGIFISSDNAYLNMNFQDLRLDVNFESAFDTGIESINWITHPDLKEIFSKLEWFANETFDKQNSVEIANLDVIKSKDVKISGDRKHYKHAQRWQLANTLTNIYGPEKALDIMQQICVGTELKELKGDIKTASLHKKPISMWAVEELNKYHGMKIETKGSDAYKDKLEKLDAELKNKDAAEDPITALNDKTETIRLHMTAKQFLSDIKDDILANLAHITLLEAGAGYGKTEMIKAFKAKTLLVLPFTSTIKAKVEASETTADWLYYYGNKRPTLDALMGPHSMSMTIDKFSHLNVMELDAADFEYIVIDESHLLFTSSYRDVMSPCIQRLANCKAKIIMMTGTPTGEILFFPKIKHIKVIKDDTRVKDFTIFLRPTENEQIYDMCEEMARDIMAGKKILFPTNKGNLFFEQITGWIQTLLDFQEYGRAIKSFYYKKSNYGDDSMENININKTIGDNDLIMCSTYLSVGVDICDPKPFSIYFNELMMPQDVEQFANRLRNNDLHIKIFLPKKASGVDINYYNTHKLDLQFDVKEVLMARDLIRTCNDMIERNEEEAKYNPLITSMLAENRYLKYDENDCKYFIDETTYKLRVFEERYAEYAKQMEVLQKGLIYYGYTQSINDSSKTIPEEKIAALDEYLKQCRTYRYNYQTEQTKKLLAHITDDNIDFYKRLLKGDYAIFKDDCYKEERGENNIYTESIEIMEKHLPVILSLYKYYDCDTIRDIYEFCLEKKQNKFNFSKLGRIKKFVGIESSIRKSKLDYPMYKFVKQAQKFAKEHPITTPNDINMFIAGFVTEYVNSIRDLVIDDQLYYDQMFDLTKELWSVIIVSSRGSKEIHIVPFELTWDRKDILQDIYGTKSTKEFFLQELVDEMKTEHEGDDEDVLAIMEATSKKTLEEVQDELPNIIHKEFDYDIYSELDGSNARFMRKQENNNKVANVLLKQEDTSEPVMTKNNTEPELFGELPF